MNELYHHGIKGMKWGVKNGPPYPIIEGTKRRDLDIKTAKRYQFSNKNYNNRDTYISYKKEDLKIYEEWIKRYANKAVYELTYEFKTTLKLPSKHVQRECFDELTNNKNFKSGLNKMYACRELVNKDPNTDFNDPQIKKHIHEYKNDIPLNKQSFNTFVNWFTLRNIDSDIDIAKNLFIDELKKRGYNAITDLNDYGSMSHDPLIVFDVEELISKVSHKKLK